MEQDAVPQSDLASAGSGGQPGCLCVSEPQACAQIWPGEGSSCKTVFWDQQPACKLRHVQPPLHKTLCGRVYPSMTDAAQCAVQVSRDLFVSFIASKPRTLQIYLHKVCPASSDIVTWRTCGDLRPWSMHDTCLRCMNMITDLHGHGLVHGQCSIASVSAACRCNDTWPRS